MSRWRPPRPGSSPYITATGERVLRDELKRLLRVERPDLARRVGEAAALGDRSENADYIYGKRQLRQMDGRIRHLTVRLDQVTIVDRTPDDPSRVRFGAWVRVEDDDGKEHVWRIVGADEIDPSRGWISIDSPVARALVGRGTDDTIEVADRAWTVLEVGYVELASG